MTFDDHNSAQGDELDPEGRFTSLTGSLGSAFQSQADRFEPSNDAYTKLAQAVSQDQDRRGRNIRTIGLFRPMVAAAAVVATVGIGGTIIASQGSQSVDTGPGGSQSALEASPVDGDEELSDDADAETLDGGADDTTSTTTPSADVESGGDTERPFAAINTTEPGYGPIRSTRLEAAQAFMDLLGMDNGYPAVEENDRVVVYSFGEGGVSTENDRVVATLAMANLGEGFAVAEASSESVFIDAVFGGTGDDATMRIEGSGHGFESILDVEVMAAFDSRVLGTGYVGAGNFGEVEPFVAEVDVVGHEHGWVIVSSSGGADRVIEPFAAKPVSFESVPNRTDYAVVGVAADDPDGGLVVRSGPGTGYAEIAVLPGGTSGLTRSAEYPVQVGTSTWWSIVTPDGANGWVNSRFVASNEPIEAEALSLLASQVRFFVSNPLDLPLTDRIPVAIGSIVDPITVSSDELTDLDGWTERRTFPMPEAYGQPEETPLIALTMAEGWVDVEPEFDARYSYDANRSAAETYFAGLSSVVFTQESTSEPWTRTFVYAENTPGGPKIVGIVVEVQEP